MTREDWRMNDDALAEYLQDKLQHRLDDETMEAEVWVRKGFEDELGVKILSKKAPRDDRRSRVLYKQRREIDLVRDNVEFYADQFAKEAIRQEGSGGNP